MGPQGQFRDYYDEQLEIRMPGDYPEGEQVLRGREGFAQLLAMLRDTWTEFRFEQERFIGSGHRVVVFVRVDTPSTSGSAPAAGTRSRSSPQRASSPAGSGACSPVRRTMPTRSPR